jgi:hypothetical protein
MTQAVLCGVQPLPGEDRLSLVYTIIPPGAIFEGYVHTDFDEYIFFESQGRAIQDNEMFDVPAKAVLHAKTAVMHECVNISDYEALGLLYVFVPPLKPYAKHDSLITRTNAYLNGAVE